MILIYMKERRLELASWTMVRTSKYIFIFLIVLASILSAADITVESALDRNKAYIGDRIEYELKIIADSTIRIDTVAPENLMGDFKVRNWQLKRDTIADGRRIMDFAGIITTYETGKVVIPAFPIKYHSAPDQVDTIYTDSIEVFVLSLVLDDSTADIKALKEVKAIGRRLVWIYYLIPIIVVVAVLIIWLLVRRKKNGEELVSGPLKNPWEEARDRLIILKEKNLEAKPFYLEFSEIIRAYLQRRFGFSALDMTTYEIKQNSDSMNIESDLKVDLAGLLESSDLVKFAKLVPPAEQMNADLEKAWSFVESTTPGKQKIVEVQE